MTTHTAIILGVWVFAASTAFAKNVNGWFMLVAFLVALATSITLL